MIKMCKEFYYRIQVGDTLNDIICKFNTSVDSIIRNDNSIDLQAGEWVIIKTNDYITYTVRPMDTLDKISIKFDIPTDKIKSYNNLVTDKLYIGQTLKIKK